jgi:mono/diheme cytochrome c family protein
MARTRRAAALAAAACLLVPPAGAAAGPDPELHPAPPLAQIHYMLHCQGCHLADGGESPGKVPALRDSVARYLAVDGGREYLVRVPGVSQAPLDDRELAAVLNWVVARFGPAGDALAAAPFTSAEIARVRRPPLTDVTRVRDELRRRLGAR